MSKPSILTAAAYHAKYKHRQTWAFLRRYRRMLRRASAP